MIQFKMLQCITGENRGIKIFMLDKTPLHDDFIDVLLVQGLQYFHGNFSINNLRGRLSEMLHCISFDYILCFDKYIYTLFSKFPNMERKNTLQSFLLLRVIVPATLH